MHEDIVEELHTGEADSKHCLYTFLRNDMIQPKTRNFTGQILRLAFRLPWVTIRDDENLHRSNILFQAKRILKWYDWIGVHHSIRRQMERRKTKFLCASSAPHINHRRMSPVYKYQRTSEIQISLMLQLLLDFLISLSSIRKNAGAIFLLTSVYT